MKIIFVTANYALRTIPKGFLGDKDSATHGAADGNEEFELNRVALRLK